MPEGVISVSPEKLRELYEQVADIDLRLDQKGTRGKRTIAHELVEQHRSRVEKLVSSVSTAIGKIEDQEARYAAYFGLTEALKEVAKEADAFTEAEFESRKAQETAITDTEAKEMQTQREAIVHQYEVLRNLLEAYGVDLSDIPTPSSRRGGAPKGPRELSKFAFSVQANGDATSYEKLSQVAEKENMELAKLKEHIASSGVDLSKEALASKKKWEVPLPSGGVLVAERTQE